MKPDLRKLFFRNISIRLLEEPLPLHLDRQVSAAMALSKCGHMSHEVSPLRFTGMRLPSAKLSMKFTSANTFPPRANFLLVASSIVLRAVSGLHEPASSRNLFRLTINGVTDPSFKAEPNTRRTSLVGSPALCGSGQSAHPHTLGRNTERCSWPACKARQKHCELSTQFSGLAGPRSPRHPRSILVSSIASSKICKSRLKACHWLPKLPSQFRVHDVSSLFQVLLIPCLGFVHESFTQALLNEVVISTPLHGASVHKNIVPIGEGSTRLPPFRSFFVSGT